MTTGAMERFLKEGHGTIPSARLVTRRAVTRTLCLLAFFVLIYHVSTSAELRGAIGDVHGKDVNTADVQAALRHSAEQLKLDGEDAPPSLPITRVDEPKLTLGKEKATLLMLVRNRELHKALGSMRMIEDRFNKKFHYPWTFMNNRPFTEEFKKYAAGMASGPVEFVQIPTDHWSIPEHINRTLMEQGMTKLQEKGVIYGGSSSYRHMCRFNSGFFYREGALKKYKWYWRVEPDVEFHCDLNYDPFTFMRENKKVYGWVLSMYEFKATIPTLWKRTKEFVAQNPRFLAQDNSLNWLVDGANVTRALAEQKLEGEYNMCHFWSNFEIASLDFFRSEPYQKYFDYLDSKGGFFYERWGDAPVHSLAVSLFAPRQQIHHFADIGYTHAPAGRCPADDDSHVSGRCFCDRSKSFDLNGYSCAPRWFRLNGVTKGAVPPLDMQT